MSTLKTNNIQHVDRSDPSIIINTDGSVNIAGTMTYEDVTNVDAVGIITGRSNIDAQKQVHVGTGVSIKAGGLNVTAGISTFVDVSARNITVSAASTFTGNIKQTAPGSSTAKLTLNNASDTTGMDVGYSESSGLGFINVGQSGSGLSIKTGGTAAGNERIRIESGGDVGIATDNPAAKLHVLGTSKLFGQVTVGADNDVSPNSSGAGQLRIDGNGYTGYIAIDGTAMYVGHNASARDLRFQTNETDRVTIDASGFVGIGTANPDRMVHIYEATNNNLLLLESGDTNVDIVQADTGGSTRIRNSQGSLIFYVNGDASSNNATNAVTALTIDPDKDVHVSDDLFIPDKIVHEGDTNTAIRFPAADTISLETAGDERLRVQSDGKIQYSHATDNVSVTSSNSSRLRFFGGSNESVSNGAVLTLHGVSHSAGNYADLAAATGGHIQFRIGTNEKFRIDSVGSALFTNGLQIGVDEGSSTSGGLLIHRYSNTNLNDGVDFDLTITWPHSNVGVFMIECFSGHSHYQGNPMYYKVVGMYGGSSAGTGGIRMTSIQETNTNSLSFSDTSNATQRGNSSNYSITITGRTGLSDTGTSLKSHVHVYVHSRIAPVSVTIS